MKRYLLELGNYLQYKILAGLWATIWSDEILFLLFLFVGLEFLDIFSRWLALSKKCYKSIYPQSPCSLWKSFTFLWQARKWRYIKSDGLRDGFCDKMLTYLLLLLLAIFVDGALIIVHIPGKIMLTIITTVLVTTEALSVLENLSECGVSVITEIKEKFKKKVDKNGIC